MSFTLVASTNPATPCLSPALLSEIGQHLMPLTGTTFVDGRMLAEGIAAEFTGLPALDIAPLRAAMATVPVDLNLVESENRRKRLLVADLESTLIDNEMLDDLAAEIGIGDQIAAITQKSMRGEVDFAQSVRERVALLANLPLTTLDKVGERIRITPGAPTLIATMAKHGAHCAIATGGFGYFAIPVAEFLGCHTVHCNQFVLTKDEAPRLTGSLVEPVFDRAAKRRTLETLAGNLGISAADTIAVGDGANDLDMLAAAGFGVAFRAKPIVADAARLSLTYSDLTGLLFLQGYTGPEIVRP